MNSKTTRAQNVWKPTQTNGDRTCGKHKKVFIKKGRQDGQEKHSDLSGTEKA